MPTVRISPRWQPQQQRGLPVPVSTRQAQEQAESTNHSTSSTRVPRPAGNVGLTRFAQIMWIVNMMCLLSLNMIESSYNNLLEMTDKRNFATAV